jgi:hypothetical protein
LAISKKVDDSVIKVLTNLFRRKQHGAVVTCAIFQEFCSMRGAAVSQSRAKWHFSDANLKQEITCPVQFPEQNQSKGKLISFFEGKWDVLATFTAKNGY